MDVFNRYQFRYEIRWIKFNVWFDYLSIGVGVFFYATQYLSPQTDNLPRFLSIYYYLCLV